MSCSKSTISLNLKEKLQSYLYKDNIFKNIQTQKSLKSKNNLRIMQGSVGRNLLS